MTEEFLAAGRDRETLRAYIETHQGQQLFIASDDKYFRHLELCSFEKSDQYPFAPIRALMASHPSYLFIGYHFLGILAVRTAHKDALFMDEKGVINEVCGCEDWAGYEDFADHLWDLFDRKRPRE